MTYIYGLYDPRTSKIRYVGKADDPQARLKGHIKQATGHKRAWFDELLGLGLSPVVVELDVVDVTDWQEAEREWIAYFRGQGTDLLNIAKGGNGPAACSEETRRKLSILKANPRNIAHLKALSQANCGRNHSEATKQKIREKALGRSVSLETRAKRRALMLGQKMPEATRRKISKSKQNSPRNREILEMMRQKNIGRPHPCSEETRKKISLATQGRKLSAETRAKMCEAQWQRRDREQLAHAN
jgi:group I intron endonuclease